MAATGRDLSAKEQLRVTALDVPSDEASSVAAAWVLGGDGVDYGRDVFCRADGTCVLFGDTNKSFGKSTDLLAVGLAADQSVQWARTYGRGHKDQISRVALSGDGGFLVLGLSSSYFFTPLPGEHPSRPLLLRLTPTGDVLWAVTLDGFLGSPEPVGAAEGPDGGWFVIMNREIGKPFFVKMSASGEVAWSGDYEFPAATWLLGIVADGDAGFLCAGRLQEAEESDDVVVLAVDPAGQPRWAKAYGADHDQDSWSLTPMAGGALVSGATAQAGGGWDILALAIDPEGAVRWAGAYGSDSDGKNEWSTRAFRDPTGRTLLCGGAEQEGPNGFLALVDDAGAMVAAHRVRSDRGEILGASALPGSRFLVVGSTSGDSKKDFKINAWTWNAAAGAGAGGDIVRREQTFEERGIEVSAQRRERMGTPHPFVDVDVKEIPVAASR